MATQTPADSVTLHIPPDVLLDVDSIAKATEHSRSWVILRALRTYLLNEGADILAYDAGRQEIANGDFEDFEKVMADMDRISADKVA